MLFMHIGNAFYCSLAIGLCIGNANFLAEPFTFKRHSMSVQWMNASIYVYS